MDGLSRILPGGLALLLAALLLTGAGCAGSSDNYGVSEVSGIVTLDDKPVPKITVYFAPQTKDGEGNPGPNSFGVTGEDGRYKLMTVKGEPGGVVGLNNVSITGEYWEGDKLVVKEFLPRRYHQDSELTFDVPPGGTDKADFAIQSK